MEHTPLVNAIMDVLFNENEIRSTAYSLPTPDVEDRKVSLIIMHGTSLSWFCLYVRQKYLLPEQEEKGQQVCLYGLYLDPVSYTHLTLPTIYSV